MVPGLERALERQLARVVGRDVRLLQRHPYPYGSSHALEAIDVRLDDGSTRSLLIKGSVPATGNGLVRPGFVVDDQREAEVYERILRPCNVSAPAFFGRLHPVAAVSNKPAVASNGSLVLEHVTGTELYQRGDFETWLETARWLARFHARFTLRRDEPRTACRAAVCARSVGRLLVRDGEYHRRFWRRAVLMADRAGRTDATATLAAVRDRFERALERSFTLPRTFIHGEFYAANILVVDRGGNPEIVPVDWEMASLGPGLLDLAALTSGRWNDDERDAMADAYRGALPEPLQLPSPGFRSALTDCRLLLAVQWLGWAADWTPPPEQRQDWLLELHTVASLTEERDPYFVSPAGN